MKLYALTTLIAASMMGSCTQDSFNDTLDDVAQVAQDPAGALGPSPVSGLQRSLKAPVTQCLSLSSTWTPTVGGSGPANRQLASGSVSKLTTEALAPLTGKAQSLEGRLVSVPFAMPGDLGLSGSVSLVGELTSFPSDLQGEGFAYLVSLSDGTNEWINLSSACMNQGLFTCSGSSCSANASCTVQSPSAFHNRNHWEQNQLHLGYTSTNVFPNCSGGAGFALMPSLGCAFSSQFFVNGKLRFGASVNYTAQFAVIADRYASLNPAFQATLRVSVVKKPDLNTVSTSSGNGGIPLNVILVGSDNVIASKSVGGRANLNALLTRVQNIYAQANSGIRFSQIRAFEWGCGDSGNSVTTVDIGTGVEEVESLFYKGSSMVQQLFPAEASGVEGINLFLVRQILDTETNFETAGLTGLQGPFVHGTGASGLLVGTLSSIYGDLAASPSNQFIYQVGNVIAHEMGHYLGLEHPSEQSGTAHDLIPDSPICPPHGTPPVTTISYVSCLNAVPFPEVSATTCQTSCQTQTPGGASYSPAAGRYCPSVNQCQFNHVMWYREKNYSSAGSSDGTLFSGESGMVVNSSSFVQ